MRWWLVAVSVLVGCGGPSAGCEIPGAAGGVVGTVDGERWTTGGAAWNETGTGIQITMQSGDGYRATFSLQETVDGIPLTEVIEDGPVPAEVSFDDGTAAFALLYEDGVSGSMSSQGTLGGSLTVSEVADDGTIGACFVFEAKSADGTAMVEGGLKAPPM